MENNDVKLFKEFPSVSTEEWEAKIHSDLKGADYHKKLIWKTGEGLELRPYYRKEDTGSLSFLKTLPGDFPFVRGIKRNNNDWFIRQDIKVKDVEKANKKALDILMKGINSLGFIFDGDIKPQIENIEKVTKNIFADSVELNFECEDNHLQMVKCIDRLAKKYNRDLENIRGSVNYDPVAGLVLKGRFPVPEDESYDIAKKMVDEVADIPNFKVLIINGDIYAEAGASIIQQLAFSLAHATTYLTQLTERGLSINKVAPRVLFQFAVGSDYFPEIAKLRAARLLWAHIVKAYGASHTDTGKIHIHAKTLNWNKTVYDPYVNLLRTTTESMAAIIAGVDSFTVLPFDSVYEEPGDFQERLARNQQLILKEESYFDKVLDPAAGSYYIEELTSEIAGKAWELFLQIQEKGGFVEAFKHSFIQQQINETVSKRNLNIAFGKKAFLGTNKFPNITESIDTKISKSVFEPEDKTTANPVAETLKPYRGALEFEKLRYKTDVYAKNNKRPRVFLITLGNLAMRRARAQFASNFFGCAGFDIIDNTGFGSTDEAVEEFFKTKSGIAVICSSDEEYIKYAPDIYNRLKDSAIVVIAGYPETVEQLKAEGIEHFIHIKSNILETLRNFQRLLGI